MRATTDDLNVWIYGQDTPHDTQLRFLRSGAKRKVYIGPFGSGKTRTLYMQAAILSHMFPDNCGLIGRYTYPELRDTTRKQFMEYADPELVDESNTSIPDTGDGQIAWKCGGVTLFRNLDRPEKFGSLALGYAGIDEIAECPSSVFDHLDGRVGRHWSARGRTPDTWPYSPVFGAGNPGGRDWIWKLFFSPQHDQREFAGFQPQPRENEQFLPPGYYDNLARGKAEWWIRRFIQGDMRALEGLVWPQYVEELSVVRDFPLPKAWRRVVGLDHGRRNPTAATWIVTDTDGNLIVYREYQIAGPSVAEHARAIRTRDKGETIERRVADPSMFNKTQSRGDKWYSVADEYREWGLDLEPGDNAMKPSLDRVGTLLWPDPQHAFPQWHPKAGQKGAPRLYFFRSCEQTISQVSAWRFKDFRGDGMGLREEPVDVDDHLCDCIRYVAMSFPEASEAVKVPRIPDRDEWSLLRQKRLSKQIFKRAQEGERREPDYA